MLCAKFEIGSLVLEKMKTSKVTMKTMPTKTVSIRKGHLGLKAQVR